MTIPYPGIHPTHNVGEFYPGISRHKRTCFHGFIYATWIRTVFFSSRGRLLFKWNVQNMLIEVI